MPPLAMPPPLALAHSTDVLRPAGVLDPLWSAKWDGWRAVWGGGRLWGRRGTDLTGYFPDLVPVLAARLPADVVVDGEVVAWDSDRGRLDFQGLSRRLTAGRRLAAAAAARPAHLVCFDLLAAGGIDLRPRPLTERWARLEEILSGISAPIVLCQQTDDEDTALHWHQTLTVAGIEGLVIKAARSTYPTRADQRVWHKLKARTLL